MERRTIVLTFETKSSDCATVMVLDNPGFATWRAVLISARTSNPLVKTLLTLLGTAQVRCGCTASSCDSTVLYSDRCTALFPSTARATQRVSGRSGWIGQSSRRVTRLSNPIPFSSMVGAAGAFPPSLTLDRRKRVDRWSVRSHSTLVDAKTEPWGSLAASVGPWRPFRDFPAPCRAAPLSCSLKTSPRSTSRSSHGVQE